MVNDGLDRESWHAARRTGISASTLAKAMTPAGRRDVLAAYADPEAHADDLARIQEYLDHGQRREQEFLAGWIERMFGIIPNRAVYAHDVYPRHLATPDGWHPERRETLEVKTSTKAMPKTIPRAHRDQMLFAMWVMDSGRCLYVWEQHSGFLATGLPEYRWFDRDEERIAELVTVANGLLWEMDEIDEELAA